MKSEIPMRDVAAIFTHLAMEAVENKMKCELDSFCFNTFLPPSLTNGEEVAVRVEILNGCIWRVEFLEFSPQAR